MKAFDLKVAIVTGAGQVLVLRYANNSQRKVHR